MQRTMATVVVCDVNGAPHRGQPAGTCIIICGCIICGCIIGGGGMTDGVSRGGSTSACRLPHLLQSSELALTGVAQREQNAGARTLVPHFAQNAASGALVAPQLPQFTPSPDSDS